MTGTAHAAPPPRWTPTVYKTVDGFDLSLYATLPDPAAFPGQRPALVMYHGGGWNGGEPTQFRHFADDLADRGVAVLSVQYRLKSVNDTTPFEAVIDAFDAFRWVTEHADELGLDPARLGAGGGSAGGHLAAAVATLTAPDLTGDHGDRPRPAALVLFNPVYDNGPEAGYGTDRLGDRWPDFSPAHNLHAAMPPTLTMLGDNDRLIPVAVGESFRDRMRALGARSELIIYPGEQHSFFNYAHGATEPGQPGPMYLKTRDDTIAFLASLGWIDD
ncbi:MAG: alpha/beta hydrolase, partial [Planctomycetota bacterium]